jgi:hypothetical protein
MRLLDERADKALDRIAIYLTQGEAEELRDSILALLLNPRGNHSHVPSEDFHKELTICIYDADTIPTFNGRSQKLILNDE